MTYLRVKELAEEQGLNILTLSQRTQLAYSTVLGLWHDRTDQLNRKTLDRLAVALGVRVSDLFGGDPVDTRVEKESGPWSPAPLAAPINA